MKGLKTFLALFAVVIAGCSMDISLEQVSKKSPIKFQSAKLAGLISGSSQIGTATGNGGDTYIVQSTVGNYISSMEQTTSDNSYKIYSSVQGSIISN